MHRLILNSIDINLAFMYSSVSPDHQSDVECPTLCNLNLYLLEVVSRYRDPQHNVGKNYSYMITDNVQHVTRLKAHW